MDTKTKNEFERYIVAWLRSRNLLRSGYQVHVAVRIIEAPQAIVSVDNIHNRAALISVLKRMRMSSASKSSAIRLGNAFTCNDVFTLDRALSIPPQDYFKFNNIGKKTLLDFIHAVNAEGITWVQGEEYLKAS